jgi:hypothetical protein
MCANGGFFDKGHDLVAASDPSQNDVAVTSSNDKDPGKAIKCGPETCHQQLYVWQEGETFRHLDMLHKRGG